MVRRNLQNIYFKVNILQKSITFARDCANFCQQNFGENFDRQFDNLNAKLYLR